MKIALFLVGNIILIGAEIAKVYFIMPFPGSQEDQVIDIAYYLHNNINLFRIVGFLLMSYPAYQLIRYSQPAWRWTAVSLIVFWLFVFYNSNFKLLADKMFYQPEHTIVVSAADNKVSDRALVLGVVIHDEAKAYPIEIIGYHHQVRDTVGGESIMVTYCTVCRTGRVYSPKVDGTPETFRLVGMDHFNAMFEDSRTKSWWRQVSGEAITGPLKGKQLEEIPSEQMTLKAWLTQHPDSFVLQPDSSFKEAYAGLEKYDEGKMDGNLERTDSLSWKDKSWVVGVSLGLFAKAYDWNDLKTLRVINDEIEKTPVVVALENDTASFHVWSRIVVNDTLQFLYRDSVKTFIDTKTNSVWDWSGRCTEGTLKGTSLKTIQSYQEYWHSWRTFHPNTERYIPSSNQGLK